MSVTDDLMRFNKALALSRLGGDEELLKDVVQMFLEEYPQLIAELRNAVQRQDASAVHHTAHTLKGSAGALGAEEAMQAALALEMLGRQQDLSSAAEALSKLEKALERLAPELQEHRAGGR